MQPADSADTFDDSCKSRTQVTSRPARVGLFSTSGADAAHFDVFLRSAQEGESPVDHLPRATCSLPGWSVRAVPDSTLPVHIARFRASGPAEGPGIADGAVSWSEPGQAPLVCVPLRMITRLPMAASSGGCVFTRIEPADVVVRLSASTPGRIDVPAVPSRVSVVGESDGQIGAALIEGGGAVSVAFRPGAPAQAREGAVRVRALDEHGRVLAEFPVAWLDNPR